MKVCFLTQGFYVFLFLFASLTLKAQMPDAITIIPENATVYDDIILTFDPESACYENGSLAGLSTIAMHSGVTINGTTWQNSVSFNSTGVNGQSPVLTSNPDGTFSIAFNPYEFYGFPAGSNVTQICAVFNNGTDWNKDGRDFLEGGPDCSDFFIPILTGSPYEPALNSIVPGQGIQGETINVQIFGVNTNFENGSTEIWIEQDATEILMTSYYCVNDTLISGTLTIPGDAGTGFYYLNVTTPLDGLMTLGNAFKVLSSGGTMPAAISISPSGATAYDELTLTFYPEEACFISGSLVGSDVVYIHSGVTYYTGQTWQDVVDFSGVGMNNQSPQLTDNGDGSWSITYTPAEFYGFTPGTVVTHICAVFNNGTWDFDGRDFEEGTSNCMDIFIPLNYTTGLNDHIHNSFSISPNPVKTELKVSSNTNLLTCYITNILGNQILTKGISYENCFSLDVKNLERGIYFIHLIDCNNIKRSQIFIKD